MLKNVQLLLSYRKNANVHPKNPYLFGVPGTLKGDYGVTSVDFYDPRLASHRHDESTVSGFLTGGIGNDRRPGRKQHVQTLVRLNSFNTIADTQLDIQDDKTVSLVQRLDFSLYKDSLE
ncbi:hypothetical protein ALC62_16003 [Cyphomyrmex costatus]|uniref:Uncharacterized protein n=1 Tax=Cyphomyrmex costatus TaxID=456900 RepID=A0A151I6S5_9HYME|nr:hypothetical protein ALC62_16003 [Cyphomyrmex costatus]